MWRSAVVAIAAFAAGASAVSGQALRGLLLENLTDRPIDLGTVVLLGETGDTVSAALTDENGFFSLTAPEPGTYSVLARALGYTGRGRGPFELEEGELQVVQLTLDPAPVPIEGVGVRTTPIVITDDQLLANGFYDRMMEGRGQFLTPEDVARSDVRYTPQVLRGLDHVRAQYGASGWKTWPRLWSPYGGMWCEPRVYVDDDWVNRPGFKLSNYGLDDFVSMGELKAVELYWGHQAPPRYRWDGPGCGAVVIWTKEGR
jgi:hypothetical protein